MLKTTDTYHNKINHVFRSLGLYKVRANNYCNHFSSEIKAATVILDVGSGPGVFSNICADLQKTVISVDISKKYLNMQKQTISLKVMADAQHLPLRDNCVDLVLAISILEHVQDLTGTLGELHRVMSAKSKIVIQLPNMQYFIEPHSMIPLLFFFPKPIKQMFVRNLGYYVDVDLSIKSFTKRFSKQFNIISVSKTYHKLRTYPWPAGWICVGQK